MCVCVQGGPSGELINPECVVDLAGANRYEILLKVEESGHYVGSVKYHGQTIGPPCITIICLSGETLSDSLVVQTFPGVAQCNFDIERSKITYLPVKYMYIYVEF